MKKSLLSLSVILLMVSCNSNTKTIEKEIALQKREMELAEKEKQLNHLEDSIKNNSHQEANALKLFEDENYLVSIEGAGKVTLNMPISSMIKLFEHTQIKKTIKSGEGMEWDVYTIFTDNSTDPGLSIVSDCSGECIVSSITVLSELYKTKEFIGVGNTFKELVDRINPTYIMGTYEGIVVITKAYESVLFDIDGSGLDFAPEKQFEIKDIPGNREITGIRIF